MCLSDLKMPHSSLKSLLLEDNVIINFKNWLIPSNSLQENIINNKEWPECSRKSDVGLASKHHRNDLQ